MYKSQGIRNILVMFYIVCDGYVHVHARKFCLYDIFITRLNRKEVFLFFILRRRIVVSKIQDSLRLYKLIKLIGNRVFEHI